MSGTDLVELREVRQRHAKNADDLRKVSKRLHGHEVGEHSPPCQSKPAQNPGEDESPAADPSPDPRPVGDGSAQLFDLDDARPKAPSPYDVEAA